MIRNIKLQKSHKGINPTDRLHELLYKYEGKKLKISVEIIED